MYDINGNTIESVPYKVNVYGMPSINPAGYEEYIDESNIAVDELSRLSGAFGTLQYVGGICVNGKIYCTPNTASNILVYDIYNASTYTIETGLPEQKFKFTGQVLYRGKIYMMHRGMSFMLEVDPATDKCRVITLDVPFAVSPVGDYQDSYHYCGALSDEGVLYQPPAYNNQYVLKTNMRSFKSEKIKIPYNTYTGAVRVPNANKIIFMGSTWLLWDCDKDSYTVLSGMPSGCYDLVYDSRYNMLVGTTTGRKFIGISLTDYSLIESSATDLTTGYGISLGLDGKYWHLEGKRAYWAKYSAGAFTTGYIESSDTFSGSTPYVAGQAIDTNGTIYGIPASGSMSALTFTGVADEIPEYLVSSQYYGKY